MIYVIILLISTFCNNYTTNSNSSSKLFSNCENTCEHCSNTDIKKKEEVILNLEKMAMKLREEIIKLGKLIIECGDTSDELAKWLKISIDFSKQFNSNITKKSEKKK